jgi:peroxin-16
VTFTRVSRSNLAGDDETEKDDAGGTAAPVNRLTSLEAWAARRQALALKTIYSGELLHLLRPVIYTLALRRWGRRSWKPWLISLAVETASWRLSTGGAAASQDAARHAASHPAVRDSSLSLLYRLHAVQWRREELDELTRRKLLLLYYLIRDPFFHSVTLPRLKSFVAAAGRVPLFGRVAEKVLEILVGAQRYYTYTAAS